MPLKTESRYPVMCITQDGLPLTHVEQATRLCAAGARWLQLRTKTGTIESRLAVAREVVAVCRAHGVRCIINDEVDLALAARADGVHLGKLDGDWCAARARLGSDFVLGGTINDAADARRATACGVLDYVGIGPWRFTTTKRNLSPVLGADGIRALLPLLDRLPAWVIGGVLPADLASIRPLGVAGVAVSSALFKDGRVAANHEAFVSAWREASASEIYAS